MIWILTFIASADVEVALLSDVPYMRDDLTFIVSADVEVALLSNISYMRDDLDTDLHSECRCRSGSPE